MSEEDPEQKVPVVAAGEQDASAYDPYPDLPGPPDMPYAQRRGLKNLNDGRQKAPNFGPDNRPEKTGRTPGVKNRKTLLRQFLDMPFRDQNGNQKVNPLDPSQKLETCEDAIIAALVAKGIRGSERAVELILDGAYGKVPNKQAITDGEGEDVPVMVQFIDDIK